MNLGASGQSFCISVSSDAFAAQTRMCHHTQWPAGCRIRWFRAHFVGAAASTQNRLTNVALVPCASSSSPPPGAGLGSKHAQVVGANLKRRWFAPAPFSLRALRASKHMNQCGASWRNGVSQKDLSPSCRPSADAGGLGKRWWLSWPASKRRTCAPAMCSLISFLQQPRLSLCHVEWLPRVGAKYNCHSNQETKWNRLLQNSQHGLFSCCYFCGVGLWFQALSLRCLIAVFRMLH